MPDRWTPTTLTSEEEVIHTLIELQGKRWQSRGQPNTYNNLIPSIDREREHLSRTEKLMLERQSIDIFRSTARFFADEGEKTASQTDIGALMVLRHYGAPTRLLDWSKSPFVAAYFAVSENDTKAGEIWSFDYDQYLKKGGEQWRRWPDTTKGGDGYSFESELTAFKVDEPGNWFVCLYYGMGFPRQKAQSGFFTFTARFGRDHADSIANLLLENIYYHRYLIPADLKFKLRRTLRDKHGIWRGSMFPDSAGAAETAKDVFKQENTADIAREDHEREKPGF
jgi:hypothetical protein